MRSPARKSGERERGVGAHDAHEADIGEVEALRDHLRAHEAADLALAEALERIVEVLRGLHRVAVDAEHGLALDKRWKEPRELLLHALGAEAEDCDGLAAIGAVLREELLGEAVVAADIAPAYRARLVDMADHAGVALGAGELPVAARVAAGDVVGVAAAVEEEEHLPAVGEAPLHRVAQRGADEVDAAIARHAAFLAEIDDGDLGRVEAGRAPGQTMECRDPALDGVHPALEAWRGAAEDDRALGELRAADGAVAAVVAGRGVLLVAGLVLLVDDHQAKRTVGNRREDRAARADDDIGAAFGKQRPLLVALRLGEARVEDGDLAVREPRGDAADGLRRERDLGYEQDGALAARDALLEQADVHLGLARAGDAEDEVLGELAEIAGNRGDRGLLLGGRRRRGGDVARARDEARFDGGLLDRHEVARGDEALERFVRRVARGLGEVGQFDGSRERAEHIERVLLALGDPGKLPRTVEQRRREIDQRALDAADRLAHGGGQDRREGHADRTGVVAADPAGELHQFGRKDDARRVLREQWLDLLARDAGVFGVRQPAHDPAGRRRRAAAERNLDARALGEMRERLRQRVGQPVRRTVDRALDGDDDQGQVLREGVGREQGHAVSLRDDPSDGADGGRGRCTARATQCLALHGTCRAGLEAGVGSQSESRFSPARRSSSSGSNLAPRSVSGRKMS